ncbi:MAG: hypothetical protein SGJ18_04140 [Pseudomonadota bacterium]|nr:hypothetical protein [Pseudomonadota bacterium]
MKKTFFAIIFLPVFTFAAPQEKGQKQNQRQDLIKIVEVSKKEKTTIVFAQDQKLGWVEMNELDQKPQRKSFKKVSIHNMEISLIDFVWDYKFKQNISEVKCADYVEVHLLSTEDVARVCQTDARNMAHLRPYIKWVRKSLS